MDASLVGCGDGSPSDMNKSKKTKCAGGETRVQLVQLLRGEGGVVDWAVEEKEEEGDDAISCLRP